MTEDASLDYLKKEADRCVKCGLCLPECPTYQLTRDEAESPRGRISLIEAVANKQLQLTSKLDSHLDNCLLCQRCEQMCPSQVRYTELMDHARSLTLSRRPLWLRLMVSLISQQRWAKPLTYLSRWALVPKRFHLPASFRLVPIPRQSKKSIMASRGAIGLFTGCVSGVLQSSALQATEKVLTDLGYEVLIPKGQVCCGAMHAHLGDIEKAKKLIAINQRSFQIVDCLISVASGCGAHLQQSGFDHHLDISAFLMQPGVLDDVRFKALNKKVSVHLPCTLCNVLKTEEAVFAVLKQIPELEVMPLDFNESCCGSAGTHSLTHPAMAKALLQPKLDSVKKQNPDILITANPGCAAHFAKGFAKDKSQIRIMHPVELLAQQWVM